MNTAAVPVTASPLQVALQIPADPAAPVAAGDFTAALAAACMAEPEAGLPEGVQSAAALAWLAGIAGAAQPLQSQPGGEILVDSGGSAVADPADNIEDVSAAALGFLQGMLVPVVSSLPQEPVAHSAVTAAATRIQEPENALVPTVLPAVSSVPGIAGYAEPDEAAKELDVIAPGIVVSDAAAAAVVQRAAPVAVPLAMMRALTADAQPDVPAVPQGDPGVTASTADGPASSDAPADSSVGERLIGALAERVSMRTEGAGVHADADRSSVAGTNPYANTRETVAAQSGYVSNRPEVVHSTVGSPRWANELGSKLAMMTVRGQQEGSLTLTPEHLGPLEVKISVTQDSTNVWFGAQHADTRTALADALPRLREMFSAAGLSLGHAGVSHQTPGQEARRGETSTTRIAADPEPSEALPVAQVRVSRGLLDAWA